jgi:hypothetical protein
MLRTVGARSAPVDPGIDGGSVRWAGTVSSSDCGSASGPYLAPKPSSIPITRSQASSVTKRHMRDTVDVVGSAVDFGRFRSS